MNNAEIIPPAVSKRICAHMNDDHAVSVFAMAKSLVASRWKVSQSTLLAVTATGAEIRAVLCQNVVCKQEILRFPFDPPLESAAEARKRLVAIHHAVTQPLVWYKQVVPWIASAIVLAMVYCVVGIGTSGMIEILERRPEILVDGVEAKVVVQAVKVLFAITVVGHLGLCTYVVYHAMKTLKLRPLSICLWYLSVAVAGVFPFQEFMELLSKATAKKKIKS